MVYTECHTTLVNSTTVVIVRANSLAINMSLNSENAMMDGPRNLIDFLGQVVECLSEQSNLQY